MIHRNTTLAVAAIVAAAALTGVAFAVPQQVMAGGHGHGHKHNHNDNNSVKVDQQVNQLNECTSSAPSDSGSPGTTANTQAGSTDNNGGSSPGTICANIGANSADIGR